MNSVNSFLREVAGDGLTFRVRGTCMDGHIPDNSRITLHWIRWPLPGDVVVIHSSRGPLMHRVIRNNPTSSLLSPTTSDTGMWVLPAVPR